MRGKPGQVRVLKGVQQVLLDTDEATTIEFRDRFDNLNALYSRHFDDDIWIFVTKDDPDWVSHLIRLGYLDAPIDAVQSARKRV